VGRSNIGVTCAGTERHWHEAQREFRMRLKANVLLYCKSGYNTGHCWVCNIAVRDTREPWQHKRATQCTLKRNPNSISNSACCSRIMVLGPESRTMKPLNSAIPVDLWAWVNLGVSAGS
jgi:hypothetical protein